MNRLGAIAQALAMIMTAWACVAVWSVYVVWLALRWGSFDRNVIGEVSLAVTAPRHE